MLIVMDIKAKKEDVELVEKKIKSYDCKPKVILGTENIAVAVTGDTNKLRKEDFQILPGVDAVLRVSKKYKLVSRQMKAEDTIVDVDGQPIGGKNIPIIAGPCSVEDRDNMHIIANALKELGIHFFRAGAYKPRSSPYAFQGMKEEGLKILDEIKKEYGFKIVTEALNVNNLDIIAEVADVIQIGARNMQNFVLIEEAGKTGKPILLKRGMSATIEELLLSAEYIAAQENDNIILCERGIRTFETATRNTLDLNAVPVVKKHSHLPILVDPSHGIGIADKVPAMAMAGIAAGADGLIVEVHHTPSKAVSDGFQNLDLVQFKNLIAKINELAPIVNKEMVI